MAIVCPRIDNTRGLNTLEISGQITNEGIPIYTGRYEDYFIDEIIPHIESNFSVLSDNHRDLLDEHLLVDIPRFTMG